MNLFQTNYQVLQWAGSGLAISAELMERVRIRFIVTPEYWPLLRRILYATLAPEPSLRPSSRGLLAVFIATQNETAIGLPSELDVTVFLEGLCLYFRLTV